MMGFHPSIVVGYILPFTFYPIPTAAPDGAAGMGLGRGGFSAAPSQGAFFAYFLGETRK